METDGFKIGRRINILLAEKNMNKMELSRKLDIPLSTIMSWNDRGSMPKADTAYKITQFFGVSLGFLLYGIEEDNQMSANIRHLINDFQSLTTENKTVIIDLISVLLSRQIQTEKNVSG